MESNRINITQIDPDLKKIHTYAGGKVKGLDGGS